MKITSLILSILGAIGAALLAMKWLGDLKSSQELVDEARAYGVNMAEIDSIKKAAYLLLATAGACVAGAVMLMKGSGRVAAAILLVGAIAPVVFAPKALVVTIFPMVAAVFAFFSRRKIANVPDGAIHPVAS